MRERYGSGMRQATHRVLSGINDGPRVHMQAQSSDGKYLRVPLCGQMAMGGVGYARTGYTSNVLQVTCRKCEAALKKAGGAA
jgi:hypothetical protein